MVATRHQAEEIVVEICDNGCGISSEVIPKIFDPFFTTKPLGQGMGLGLSVSHGIITSHGGHIDVTSEPGQGSCFRVFLPVGPVVAKAHSDPDARRTQIRTPKSRALSPSAGIHCFFPIYSCEFLSVRLE